MPSVSESGPAIGKTHNQAKALTTVSSTIEAEMDPIESLAKAETWPGMSISQKVAWKSLMEPSLLPLPTHQSHGKHRHHPIGHHNSLQSVTDHPWTSPLKSNIPENYETSIKTPTFTEAMTTTDIFTESEISNPFRTVVLEETSRITIPTGTETIVIEEIIPFTFLAEFTEIADIASSTVEGEGTPIKTMTRPGTLTTVSPITEATMLTSNLIDTSPTADSTQEIKTASAVTLPIVYTSPEAETTPAENLGVAGNNTEPKTIGERTTLTGILTEKIRTKAKTTGLPGTSMTMNSSTEGPSAFLKTNFFSEKSALSSSAEEELSTAVETLMATNTITVALSTTADIPNAVETFDTTGQGVEKTAKMSRGTLNTIYISTTEKATAPMGTAVFTGVPRDDRSTIAKFNTPAESSDKFYTTTKGTTAPGHDEGFLLVWLFVSSSLDLTDYKVAKEFLHKLCQDLQVQVPYTQISLMKVTRS